METQRWGIFIFVLVTAMLIFPSAHALGCMIVDGNTALPDADCDGVTDGLDNCQMVNNPDQLDTNRNGIGDVCDKLIEEIVVLPDVHVYQGGTAQVRVLAINNRDYPLKNVEVTVFNKELGISGVQVIPYLPQGESASLDFFVSIPKCAKAQAYSLSVQSSFVLPGKSSKTIESASQQIRVEKSNVCGTKTGALDSTIIKVMGEMQLDRGQSALVPITITNLNEGQKNYNLAIEGLGSLGTWRIDPATTLIIPGGHDSTAYLYIKTEQFAEVGDHVVMLTVTTGDETTKIPVHVYVRGVMPGSSSGFLALLFQVLLIIMILALIVVAILVAIRARNKNAKKDSSHASSHKVTPYYDDAGNAKASGSSNKMQNNKAVKSSQNKTAAQRKTVAVEPAEKSRRDTYY